MTTGIVSNIVSRLYLQAKIQYMQNITGFGSSKPDARKRKIITILLLAGASCVAGFLIPAHAIAIFCSVACSSAALIFSVARFTFNATMTSASAATRIAENAASVLSPVVSAVDTTIENTTKALPPQISAVLSPVMTFAGGAARCNLVTKMLKAKSTQDLIVPVALSGALALRGGSQGLAQEVVNTAAQYAVQRFMKKEMSLTHKIAFSATSNFIVNALIGKISRRGNWSEILFSSAIDTAGYCTVMILETGKVQKYLTDKCKAITNGEEKVEKRFENIVTFSVIPGSCFDVMQGVKPSTKPTFFERLRKNCEIVSSVAAMSVC